MTAFSFKAENYLTAHAIDLRLAWECGVREKNGGIIWPACDIDGAYWPRQRKLNGSGTKCRPVYKGRSPGVWWPLSRPERVHNDVLVCEGESDALAAISALAKTDGPHVDVASITGCGFPTETLVGELLAVGAEVACLAFDADVRNGILPTASEMAQQRFSTALVSAGIGVRLMEIPPDNDLASTLAGIREPDGIWPEDPPAWLRRALIQARPVGLELTAAIRECNWLRRELAERMIYAVPSTMNPIRRADAAA